jgi:Domain of unknown function (DUF5658)
MIPAGLRKDFPAPSVGLFFSLQSLDVLTTMIGLRAGGAEANTFVSRMMQWGPITGLAISKLFALILLAAAFRFRRQRAIVVLNFWLAAVVTWNLVVIFRALLGGMLSR